MQIAVIHLQVISRHLCCTALHFYPLSRILHTEIISRIVIGPLDFVSNNNAWIRFLTCPAHELLLLFLHSAIKQSGNYVKSSNLAHTNAT